MTYEFSVSCCYFETKDETDAQLEACIREVVESGNFLICCMCIIIRFWEKYIKGKSINGLPMHAERAHYGVCWKNCFISYVRTFHVKSLSSIDTSVWTLKTFPGILSFECWDVNGIADMSSHISWHFMTRSYECKEHPLMVNYSLVEIRMVIPYNTV